MFLEFLPLIVQLLPSVLSALPKNPSDDVLRELVDAVLKGASTAAAAGAAPGAPGTIVPVSSSQLKSPADAKAAAAAAAAVLKDDLTQTAEVQKALAELTIEKIKAQNDYELQQREIDIELNRLDGEQRDRERDAQLKLLAMDMQDRFDARSREDKLAEEGNPLAWVPPILAFSLVFLIYYLLSSMLGATETIVNRDVFNVVVGALTTAFTTIISFYFGSSAGSRDKDRAMVSGRFVPAAKAGRSASGSDDTAPNQGASTNTGAAKKSQKPQKPLSPSPGVVGLFRGKAPVIMRQLVSDLQLTAVQAAGILGNIGVECGQFRYMQEIGVKIGRGGLGWMQWTASRRKDFESWAANHAPPLDTGSDEANYGFLLHELRGPEASSLAQLRRTSTVDDATIVFMEEYERPGKANTANRVRLAKVALSDFEATTNA